MRDPIARLVFQPAVDALGLCPRRSGLYAANLFVMFAVTTAALRIASGGPETDPWLNGMQSAYLIIGAAILSPFIRFFAINGPVAVDGVMGAIHLGLRILFIAITLADVVTVADIVLHSADYTGIGLLRQLLQLLHEASAMVALYLAMCKDPPPPRPRGRRATA